MAKHENGVFVVGTSRRRPKHQKIQVVRTMSKAGMIRPPRIPSVYRTDTKLISPDDDQISISEPLQKEESMSMAMAEDEETDSSDGSWGDQIVTIRLPLTAADFAPRKRLRPPVKSCIPESREQTDDDDDDDFDTASNATSTESETRRSSMDHANDGDAESLASISLIIPQEKELKKAVDSTSTSAPAPENNSQAQSSLEPEKRTSLEEPDYIRDLKAQLERATSPSSEEAGPSDESLASSSASSQSSIPTSPEISGNGASSPEPEKLAPSTFATPNPGSTGFFDRDNNTSSLNDPLTQQNLETSKNKPLPPEPVRGTSSGSDSGNASISSTQSAKSASKVSPLVSKFNALNLNNLDREFANSNPKLESRTTRKSVSLEQATRDLETQLSSLSGQTTQGTTTPTTANQTSITQSPTNKEPITQTPVNQTPATKTLVPKTSTSKASKSTTTAAEKPKATKQETNTLSSAIRKTSTKSRNRRRSKIKGMRSRPPSLIVTKSFLCTGNDDCAFCDDNKPEPKYPNRPADPNSVSADAADMILLHIMKSMDTLTDLFSAAVINRGFYVTFKRHELPLIKSTVYKMSPSLWEFREVSSPSKRPGRHTEYSPTSYLRYLKRDVHTINQLKALILNRCESFLRIETVTGLSGLDHRRSREIDDALWRIWSFCRIFGCNKNREDDLIAQIDWLNGGSLARASTNIKTRPMSVVCDDQIYSMGASLFNPTEGFGRGNGPDGLTASQLYDMIELWNCLGSLVQQLSTNITDARSSGVFRNCNVSHPAREFKMLEEWTFYILTMGLSSVLAVCAHGEESSSPAYVQAKTIGLTNWTPLKSGATRSIFFKEALTRVYNARLAALNVPSTTISPTSPENGNQQSNPDEPGRKSADRERQVGFAAELRRKKYGQAVVDKSQKQQSPSYSVQNAMSPFAHVVAQMIDPVDRSGSAPIPLEEPSSRSATPLGHQRSASAPVNGNITNTASGVIDPTDVALWTLTSDLGFSHEEAVWALRKCETGERVEIDRAVNLLLRQRELGHSTTKKIDAYIGVGQASSPSLNGSRPPSRANDSSSSKRRSRLDIFDTIRSLSDTEKYAMVSGGLAVTPDSPDTTLPTKSATFPTPSRTFSLMAKSSQFFQRIPRNSQGHVTSRPSLRLKRASFLMRSSNDGGLPGSSGSSSISNRPGTPSASTTLRALTSTPEDATVSSFTRSKELVGDPSDEIRRPRTAQKDSPTTPDGFVAIPYRLPTVYRPKRH